ncbi:MAG TPA: acetolactate decarboxylase [Armatimonadota bacterium]|jgi:acetolactate decarboxylase
MRRLRLLLPLLLLLAVAPLRAQAPSVAPAAIPSRPGTLFQVSTIGALLAGGYDGLLSFEQLRRQGDFGLGTADALDGEMIGVDGSFYQVKADGKAYPVDPTNTTPFAVVSFFHPDLTAELSACDNLAALQDQIVARFPATNQPYAVKLTGDFDYLQTRSVPRQHPPFPPLAEVIKTQSVFEFHQVHGVLVGFWLPEYMKSLNVAGFHLHFLTADRSAGGHLLEARLTKGTLELGSARRFVMSLPPPGGAAGAANQQELQAVEK